MVSKKTNVLLIIYTLFMFLSYVGAVEIDNVLYNCDVFPKDSVPTGYDPIVGVMTIDVDANGRPYNSHLSNLSDDIVSGNYEYVLACTTNNYIKLRGFVLEEGMSCDPYKGQVYVINLSDITNAHVKSPYSTNPGEYNYELCIYPEPVEEGTGAIVYCDVRGSVGCGVVETCLFKFSGILPEGGFVDTNSHIYSCDVQEIYLPSNYQTLCCRATLSSEGQIILDVQNMLSQGDNKLYLQVGMYAQMLLTFYNPSDKPQTFTLRLSSGDDPETRIFENFVWFEDKERPIASRTKTISLKPYERGSVVVTIFGGKLGEYPLKIYRDTEEGSVEVFNTTVFIIPSSTQGFVEQSPEPGFYVFVIALIFVLMIIRRKVI